MTDRCSCHKVLCTDFHSFWLLVKGVQPSVPPIHFCPYDRGNRSSKERMVQVREIVEPLLQTHTTSDPSCIPAQDTDAFQYVMLLYS